MTQASKTASDRAKATAGPWTYGVEPSLNTIRIRDNDLDVLPIATLFYSDGGKPRYQRQEAEANAALIAAAGTAAHECEQLGYDGEEAVKALPDFIGAMESVIERWERGDLAGAVRNMAEALEACKPAASGGK